MHDDRVKHWERKSLISLGGMYFRLNTIRLVNGKFETAFLDSNPDLMIASQYIYFYNFHKTEQEATDFHFAMAFKINELNRFNHFSDLKDVLETISKEVPEMTRYTNSVPYSYPEDIFGETYR